MATFALHHKSHLDSNLRFKVHYDEQTNRTRSVTDIVREELAARGIKWHAPTVQVVFEGKKKRVGYQLAVLLTKEDNEPSIDAIKAAARRLKCTAIDCFQGDHWFNDFFLWEKKQ